MRLPVLVLLVTHTGCATALGLAASASERQPDPKPAAPSGPWRGGYESAPPADPAEPPAPDRGPHADDLPAAGPGFDQVVGTVLVCYAQESKTQALAAIQDEKQAAQYAGIVDKSRLYDLQKQAHRADKVSANGLAILKGAKRKQLHCNTPVVRYLADCLHGTDTGYAADWCDGVAWERFWSAVRVEE